MIPFNTIQRLSDFSVIMWYISFSVFSVYINMSGFLKKKKKMRLFLKSRWAHILLLEFLVVLDLVQSLIHVTWVFYHCTFVTCFFLSWNIFHISRYAYMYTIVFSILCCCCAIIYLSNSLLDCLQFLTV